MSEVHLHSYIHLHVVKPKRKDNFNGNREFLEKDNFTHNQGLIPINRIAYNTVTHYSGLGLSLKCRGDLTHIHSGSCANLEHPVKRIQMTTEMLVTTLQYGRQ